MIKNDSSRAFRRHICFASSHGYDGYRLVIKPHESKIMCVQFLVKRDSDCDGRFLFCVPRVRWAQAFIPRIQDILTGYGLDYTIIDNKINHWSDPSLPKIVKLVKKFISVDCARDIDLMVNLTEEIFAVMGWDDSFLYDFESYGKSSIRAKFKSLEEQR